MQGVRKAAAFIQRRTLATSSRPPLQLFRSLWGVDGVDEKEGRDMVFKRLKDEGFSGVESGPFIIGTGGVPKWEIDPRDDYSRHDFAEALRRHGLRFIAMVHSAGYPVDGHKGLDEHLESLEEQAFCAKEMGAELINVHGGRDNWRLQQAMRFLADVAEIEAKIGIPFVLETHRQRLFWNPWQTRDLIAACETNRIPLKLNADLSHWCAGGERLFSYVYDPEFKEIIDMVAERAQLIHARVGWSQGPQVPDPRVPEYAQEVEAHEKWWDVILDGMLRRGVPLRIEPEFGPPPYMPVDPTTKKHVADLWEVNSFIAQRQVQRWANR